MSDIVPAAMPPEGESNDLIIENNADDTDSSAGASMDNVSGAGNVGATGRADTMGAPGAAGETDAAGVTGATSGNKKPPIVNELLCYVQFYMHRSPKDNIAEVINRFYSDEEVITAKDILDDNYQGCFTHELKNRRNTRPSKNSRGKDETESTVDDILIVMYELDKSKIDTSFVALNLARLPKCDPKDVDPFSNLQLILSLQERLQQLEDNVGSVHVEVISNTESLKRNTKSIDEIEDVIAKMVVNEASFEKVIASNSVNHGSQTEVNGSGDPNVNNGSNNSEDAADTPATGPVELVSHTEPPPSLPHPHPPPQPINPNPGASGIGVPPKLVQPAGHGGSASVGGHFNSNVQPVGRRGSSTMAGNGNSNGFNGWQKVGRNGRLIRNNDRGRFQGNGGNHYGGSNGARNQYVGRRGSVQQDNEDSVARPRIRFFGTASGGAFRGGRLPKREFFISRVDPSTEDRDISDFLSNNGFSNFEIKLMSRSAATFKSYKLTVCMSDKDKVLQPDMWPQGTLVKKWKQKPGNNNDENGENVVNE